MLPKSLQIHKSLLSRFLVPLIVVLVGVGAFGLGRLSMLQEQRVGIKIYAPGGSIATSTPNAVQ